MNYYIQGNKENANQIKAAFESKGYDVTGFDMCNDNILFFTYELEGGGQVICTTNANLYTSNIIKTHPDYKELELNAESKFRVGKWVVFNNRHNSIYQISEIRDSYYMLTHTHGGSMPLSFSQEEFLRPWTIEDAKDGDVLVTTKARSCPFIYRKTDHNNNLAYYYAGIDGNMNFCEGCIKRTLFHFGSVENVVPATKEQRDLLFKKMKEAGFTWDVENKTLKKSPKHYDIANFKPKQWVLCRDYGECEWALTMFSHLLNSGSASLFACINGATFHQCIPFEGNEKLLGTTDPCDEMFINW